MRFFKPFVWILALFIMLQACGAQRKARLAKERAKCVYEDLRFVGIFLDSLQNTGQFLRLKGGTELIVLDSVTIKGKLVQDAMYRIRVRRSAGGVCGPTTGEIARM